MRAPTAIAFTLACALAVSLSGCAPLHNRTHFDRWDEQNKERKAAESAPELRQARLTERSAKPTSAGTGFEPRAGKEEAPKYRTRTPSDTPTIATSTRSRVIRASEAKPEDEEELY